MFFGEFNVGQLELLIETVVDNSNQLVSEWYSYRLICWHLKYCLYYIYILILT